MINKEQIKNYIIVLKNNKELMDKYPVDVYLALEYYNISDNLEYFINNLLGIPQDVYELMTDYVFWGKIYDWDRNEITNIDDVVNVILQCLGQDT